MKPSSISPPKGSCGHGTPGAMPTVSQWLSRSSVGPGSAPMITPTALPTSSRQNPSKPSARISRRMTSTTALSSPGGLGQRMRDWVKAMS